MVFVRKKRIAGRWYRYEVESVRDPGGTVRQRVVRYVGPESPVYGTRTLRRGARMKKSR